MRSVERIASTILVVRGLRVMIDADPAALYGVPTKRLNEQVKRNRTRFPVDFVFRLTASETAEVVANCDHLARLRFSSRETIAGRKELARRLEDLERKVGTHDRAIGQILEAIRQLTQPSVTPQRGRIGFL